MKSVLQLFTLLCYLHISAASLRSNSQITSLGSQENVYNDMESPSNNLINPISLSKNSFIQLEFIGDDFTQISSASYIQESSDVKESSESESTEVVGDENAPSQGATDPAITGY
ncbi:hypothetical protein SteCoe_9650 [Stentor coeruleus]|uniref:RxLR effector protein n=1 Tax=Stentor coeruleus TaxID=5963 RepID=A0A1R2CHE5_9CILI|nr:hypothetical protein SteCoe_9650 [Stentor coeruleus]